MVAPLLVGDLGPGPPTPKPGPSYLYFANTTIPFIYLVFGFTHVTCFVVTSGESLCITFSVQKIPQFDYLLWFFYDHAIFMRGSTVGAEGQFSPSLALPPPKCDMTHCLTNSKHQHTGTKEVFSDPGHAGELEALPRPPNRLGRGTPHPARLGAYDASIWKH